MNARKSKVMVGSSGGKMIKNSGKSTVCKNGIHKRCSGVCGDLSMTGRNREML